MAGPDEVSREKKRARWRKWWAKNKARFTEWNRARVRAWRKKNPAKAAAATAAWAKANHEKCLAAYQKYDRKDLARRRARRRAQRKARSIKRQQIQLLKMAHTLAAK